VHGLRASALKYDAGHHTDAIPRGGGRDARRLESIDAGRRGHCPPADESPDEETSR
jgi:hypothetical protein